MGVVRKEVIIMAFGFSPCGCGCGGGSGCTTGVLCFRIRNSITSFNASGGGPVYDDINVDISSTGGGAYGNTTTTTDGSYKCIDGVSTVSYRVKPTDICGSSSLANCNWFTTQTFMGIGTAGSCTTGNITLDYCCTCYCVQVTNYPYNGVTVAINGGLHNSTCSFSDSSIGGNICANSGYYCVCTPYTNLGTTSGIRLRNFTQGTIFPASVCVPNGSGGGTIYGSNCDTQSITYCDGSMNNFTANFTSRQSADKWISNITCDPIDYSCSGPCVSGVSTNYIRNKYWEPPTTLYLTVPNSMSGTFGPAAGTTITLNFDTQKYRDSLNSWLNTQSGFCGQPNTTIDCGNYGAMWDWSSCFTFSSTIKSNVHWQLTRSNPFSVCGLPTQINRAFWIDNYRAATCLSGYRSTNDLSWIFPTGQYCSPLYFDFGGGLVLSE